MLLPALGLAGKRTTYCSTIAALVCVSFYLSSIVEVASGELAERSHTGGLGKIGTPKLVHHKVVRVPGGRRVSRRRKVVKKVINGSPQAVVAQAPVLPPPPKGTPPPVTVAPAVQELAITAPTRASVNQLSRQELENALNIPGVKCGTVPIYSKLYGRSINETFDTNLSASDEQGDFRILHGLDSVVGEWPWIVRLSYCISEDTCWTCTGTLLTDRWVITAGHCGHERDMTKYRAYFGLYDLVAPEKTSFSLAIEKMVVHPEYKDLLNDLTLMKLEKPVEFSDHVQPACLVRATRNTIRFARHRKCYTVGYGLGEEMNAVERLQKLEIQAKEPSACNSPQMGFVRLRPNTVCIGPPEGKVGGSCKGDSGGPDLCYDPLNDRWELFGTVSYGPAICDRDADDRWLTVSVDLANYRSWIMSTIAAN